MFMGEPKTRFRAARHQLARLDWEDLVGLVVDIYMASAFGHGHHRP